MNVNSAIRTPRPAIESTGAVRSARVKMNGWLLVSASESSSVVTIAVFCTMNAPGRLRVTTKVSTSGGSPGASGPGCVQVMSGSMVVSQTQPVPLIETNVKNGSKV